MVAVSVDLRQTDGWAKYLQFLGWKVEKAGGSRIYIRRIPLLGSVIKIQRPAEIPPAGEIDRIARKHRALFVKLEPEIGSSRKVPGFEPDRAPNIPARTIVIDLTKTEDDIWNSLSQDARQSIRKAVGNQLEVKLYQPADEGFEEALTAFRKLLENTGGRQGFRASPLKELRAKAEGFGEDFILLLASRENRPLAGALIIVSGETAFFHHFGSSRAGQKLFASYLLVLEVMKKIKKLRPEIRRLDLEGVADPRFPQTKRWERFSVFKRKWGGEEIEYPRPLIRFYRPLIRLLFSINRV